MTAAGLHKSPTRFIQRPDQLRCLASAPRQEILDTLQALGPSSASDLAHELGRRADGLYYHLNALLAVDLIEEVSRRPSGRRQEAVYDVTHDMRIRYDPTDAVNVSLVSTVIATLLRVAERDFRDGFVPELAQVDGPMRNLWAGRGKAWLTREELKEMNGLLNRIAELVARPRRGGTRLHAFSYVLAPVPDPDPSGRVEEHR